ncbi:integrin alpha-5-like [Pipra filicauda]|uniref:Integrin alpha-5-like n=1 Tax=Pipra filicauda TaxID=649802 RepID=A0A7R5KPM6_9PASS|nr:integrin alpha-5-like [Pipra filicauda]
MSPPVSPPSINVTFCLNASGRHLPGPIGLAVDLTVDGLKAGGGRRALFLGGGGAAQPGPSPTRSLTLVVPNGGTPQCRTLPVVLRAHIQLDCGEDNVCVPDLHLEATA